MSVPTCLDRKWSRAVLWLAPLAVYSASLHSPFVYDDIELIQANSKMHGVANWADLLVHNLYPQRFFMNLLYGLSWSIGAGATWPFHLINIAVHTLNGVLLERFIRTAFPRMSFGKWALVFLFLFHPLQTQAVCYAKGIVDLLEVTCYLAALCCVSGNHLRLRLLATVLILAPWARETALLIPAVIFWYLRWVAPEKRQITLKEWLALLGCTLGSAIPMLLVGTHAHQGTVGFEIYPVILYQWNQLHGLWLYVRLLLDPGAESLFHEVRNWSVGLKITGTLGGVALLLAAASSFFDRKRRPAIAFFLFFSVLIYASKNGPLQFINGFAEYRLYLLNLPVFCLLGAATQGILEKHRASGNAFSGKPVFLSLVLAAAVLSGNLYQQRLWNDPVKLMESSLENEPDSGTLQQLLGESLEQTGKNQEATQAYQEAVRLDQQALIHSQKSSALLVQLYAREGQWDQVEEILKKMPLDRFKGGRPPLQYFSFFLEALAHRGKKAEYEQMLKQARTSYPQVKFPEFSAR